jgi:DNA polymerase III delta subunit
MVYLLLGQDIRAKNARLRQLKEQFLPRASAEFNYAALYGKDLTLKALQENLAFLPVNNPQRILVIKDAQGIDEEPRAYLAEFAKGHPKEIILVIDIDDYQKKDGFVSAISRYARVERFQEASRKADAFTLGDSVAAGRADHSLRVLSQLLNAGERPEKILGGLRYSLEKDGMAPADFKKKLKCLLTCDIEIKTGRLKPQFALEKLVVRLCGLA